MIGVGSVRKKQAKNELEHVLDNQKTISVSRLKKIINGLESDKDLKGVKRLLTKSQETVKNQRREIARMNRHAEKLQNKIDKLEVSK